MDYLELKCGSRIQCWTIGTKLGSGTFADVYHVTKLENGEFYHGALKIASSSNNQMIQKEIDVLELAAKANNTHFCHLFASGHVKGQPYIVMTLVGKTLHDLLKERPQQRFTTGCALSVGRKCLSSIEQLHRIGYVHCDIKPSNFAIGASSLAANRRQLYIIDFGLSYEFLGSNDKLVEEKQRSKFKGTLRYAALSVHKREQPGRRDDLESWMYQQIEFTRRTLPWKYIKDDIKVADIKDLCRRGRNLKHLLKGCPNSYTTIFRYIITLQQASSPDYELIHKIIRKTIFEMNLSEYPYDWESKTR